MIARDTTDRVMRSLSGLPVLTPDQQRAARLRERCRGRLRRRSTRGRILGQALFAGLCLLYLSALVLDVLRLPGVR